MIRLFRNVRKQLAGENKPAKYLRYAIGEVVLIMLGIFMALQLQNWNEKRIVHNNMEDLFGLFELELSANIKTAQRFLDYGYVKDSIQSLFYNSVVNEEMVWEHPGLILNDYGTRTVDFQEERLNEILASEKFIPEKYESVFSVLKDFKELIESQKYWEGVSLKLAMDRRKELVDTYTWYYRSDTMSIQKRIQHALNDSLYRNKVNQYTDIQLEENVWDSSQIRSHSTGLLWELIKLRDPEADVFAFLTELELKPISEKTCTEMDSDRIVVDFRRSFLIFNNSKDTVNYSFISNVPGEELVVRDLNFIPNSFFVKASTRDREEHLMIKRNDTCTGTFYVSRNDYLLIE